jgi:hypothetical protein
LQPTCPANTTVYRPEYWTLYKGQAMYIVNHIVWT